jgi:2-polyprenyl-3-methyl-5-hydroxy-6-metoxy-1,4-benzoquinol methylase
LKDNDAIVRSWDSNAAAWTEAVRGNRIPSRVAGTNEAVRFALGNELPCRVLDVGCGEGWLCHELVRRGFDVVGMDASLELVERAREGLGIFLHLSYEELCSDPLLIDGTFDRIVCNYALFEEDLHSLFRTLRSKLSPEGLLIIQTLPPAEGPLVEGSGWRSEDYCSFGSGFRSLMPYYFRSVEDWRTELNRAGLQFCECRVPAHPISGTPLSLIMVARAG